jgi:Peptidase A4 family
MSDETDTADAISHVRAYPPLPADMAPSAINDDVLREHGLPGRPDARTQPQLLRQWNRIMARPTRFIQADLAIDHVMTERHLARDPLNPDNWGGVVRAESSGSDYPYPAKMVFGEWVVPEVSAVSPDGASLEVGFWVGLDGYKGEGSQTLKAGVTATVEQGWFSSSVRYRLFTEWYTQKYKSPPVSVQNFSIAPGDTVSVLVTANGPGSGTAFFRNSRSGLGTSVAISQPQDIVSAGLTTEWIVEELAEDLPWFAPVTFTNCWGASFIEGAYEYFSLTPGAITPSIQGPLWGFGDVTDLTVTEILSPTVAKVKEVAVDWPGILP